MKKKFFSFGLKGKIILPVLAIIIIGVLTILYPVLTIFSNSSMDLSQNLTTEIAGHNAQLLSSDINSKLAIARSLKAVLEQSAADRSMSREEIMSCFKEIIENNDSIYGIFTCWEPNAYDRDDNMYKNTNWHDSTGRFIPHIIKNKGSISYSVKALKNYETEGLGDYYLLPKKTNEECILEPFYYKVKDKNYYITSIIEPLYIGYKFVGVIGIDILLDPYVNMYDNVKIYDNGYVSLFSAEGQIISHPNKDLIGSSIYDISQEDYNTKLKNVIETGEPDELSHDEIINNKTKKLITKMIPISIGNTGLNWCIGVSAPVSEIVKPVAKGMVFGISNAVIVCLLSIIILFFIIGSIIKNIYKINDDLTKSSSYVSSAATQLTSTSQDLSNGANEQAASIEQTSASIEENTSMIKQIAENTSRASQLSKKVKQSAVSGTYTIDKMTEGMEELKQSSKHISKIIKLIDDIASQTNILALNAAVEAARAGDAGRGFAVVADEVRKLAQKSTEAAKDTNIIIEKNLVLSSNGVKASEDVKRSLDNITTQIDKIVDLVGEIALASKEQSSGMQESSNAMIDMERIVQNNAAAAEESAASSEELQAQAYNLENAVKELNNIVHNKKRKKEKQQKPQKPVVKEERRKAAKEMAITVKKEHIVSPEEIIPLDEDNEF